MSKNRPVEPNGTVFTVSSQNKYVIEQLLGAGGFGNVYMVHLQRDPSRKYAMKTEMVGIPAMCERLKIECVIYEKLRTIAGNRKHFIRMVDAGITDKNKFMVVEMVSHSLAGIFNKMCDRQFSLRTTIEVADQTLKAIESLHELGWLHRDVKPGNFSVGFPPNHTTIYMLDFGTAREYRDFQGRLRVPRVSVTTPKTLMYCSLRAHNNEEQGRRDDLETWLFMMLEFFDFRNLSWRMTKGYEKIFYGKLEIIQKPVEMFQDGKLNVPWYFVKIIQEINKMGHTDPANFKVIREHLDVIVKQEAVDMSKPLDWIAKRMPEQPKVAPVPVVPPVKKDDKKKKAVKEEVKVEVEEDEEDEDDEEALKDLKIGKMLTRKNKKCGIRLTPAQLKHTVKEWKQFKEFRRREMEEYRKAHANSNSSRSFYSTSASDKSMQSNCGSENTKSKISREKSSKDDTKIGQKDAIMEERTCKSSTSKSEQKIAKDGKSEMKPSNLQEETCKSTSTKSANLISKSENTCISTSSKQEQKSAEPGKPGLFKTMISKIRQVCDRKPEDVEKNAPEAQKQ